MSNRISAVISNYALRGEVYLQPLIEQLRGKVSRIIVSTNDDSCKTKTFTNYGGVARIVRPNIGMNIGAWSEAIPYCDDSDYVIFLQDECKLVRADFVERYENLLSLPAVAMVGESINPKWDCKWSEIINSKLNYGVALPNGKSTRRVELYLSCMLKWGIDPGNRATHLRSLAWAFNQTALQAIKSFPIGFNREECIAAEISVSRMIVQKGLKFLQSDPLSFSFFEHVEWRKDGLSKII
jgi:hypothetical protein